jgi:hypothetical protein
MVYYGYFIALYVLVTELERTTVLDTMPLSRHSTASEARAPFWALDSSNIAKSSRSSSMSLRILESKRINLEANYM